MADTVASLSATVEEQHREIYRLRSDLAGALSALDKSRATIYAHKRAWLSVLCLLRDECSQELASSIVGQYNTELGSH